MEGSGVVELKRYPVVGRCIAHNDADAGREREKVSKGQRYITHITYYNGFIRILRWACSFCLPIDSWLSDLVLFSFFFSQLRLKDNFLINVSQ